MQSYVITRTQFLVELAVARIIHCSQRLSLDELAFDPTNVTKHGLTYTTLLHICTKEKLYLLAPFQSENFLVDKRVQLDMIRLTTMAICKPSVLNFTKF